MSVSFQIMSAIGTEMGLREPGLNTVLMENMLAPKLVDHFCFFDSLKAH
jgi:hypothetical protein